jgi:hypothetical protein
VFVCEFAGLIETPSKTPGQKKLLFVWAAQMKQRTVPRYALINSQMPFYLRRSLRNP